MRPLNAFTVALALVVAVMFVTCVYAENFQVGDLAVLVQGDGANALANTGNRINILELSRAGTAQQTIAVPTTIITQGSGWASNSGLIESGTASSEGQLALSPEGHTLMFAGYIMAPNTYSLSSASAAQVPRGYASIDGYGNYTFGGTFGNVSAYSLNNIRGATTDGTHVWGAGAGSGSTYGGTMLGLGNTTLGTEVELDNGDRNSRAVKIFGGNLFYSTQKGTAGVHYYSGLPTSGSPTDYVLISTGNNDSTNDFVISPGAIKQSGSYVYVADSRASSSGGVQRWDWNGSAYTLSYTFTLPGNPGGLEGIAADFSSHEIFTTTSTNVYAVTDPGSAAAMSSIYTLADTAHYAMRGISLAPVPEPSSIVLAGIAGFFGLIALAWRHCKSAL